MEWLGVLSASLCSSITSAFLTWEVAVCFGKRLLNWQEREHILRQVLISKADIELQGYIKILTYIELAFTKDKNVLDAWRVLCKVCNTPNGVGVYYDGNRDILIREISRLLGCREDTVSQFLGRQSYMPRGLSDKNEVDRLIIIRKHKQTDEELNVVHSIV